MDSSTWWGIGLIAYAGCVFAITLFKPGANDDQKS